MADEIKPVDDRWSDDAVNPLAEIIKCRDEIPRIRGQIVPTREEMRARLRQVLADLVAEIPGCENIELFMQPATCAALQIGLDETGHGDFHGHLITASVRVRPYDVNVADE